MLNLEKEKTHKIIYDILEYETGYLFTNNSEDFNTFLSNFIIILY